MEAPPPPAPARKTLFLGLDGVMHHSKSKVAGFLSCMPVLEEALGTADVDIVVLSCWDFASDFSRLKAVFPPSLRSRVVGRTTEELGSLHKRFKEIQSWLRQVPVPDWRVLDRRTHSLQPAPGDGACARRGPEAVDSGPCAAAAETATLYGQPSHPIGPRGL